MVSGAVFSQLTDVADSIVLASGTLHPHEAVISELGSGFQRRLQLKPPPLAAPHVIPQTQLQVLPYKTAKPCTHENLLQEEFLEDIGHKLLQVLRCVPGGNGVLVFFSSGQVVERAIPLWNRKVLARKTSAWMKPDDVAAPPTAN
ncbi:unnamed protein product, partial [Amoebophrya sp. A25]|eukprot:GSA25T00017288001.1